jgi:two-component system, NarL family, sensor kinase
MQSQKVVIIFLVLTTLLFFALISVILSVISLHKKKQNNFKKELELLRSEYEKELLKTQLEIQEQTFNHIALELHDNVGHFLSLAKLHLSSLNGMLFQEVRDKVDESISLLTSSLEEIRSLSKNLSTECIKENGLIKTLDQLIKQVEKSGKFLIEFYVTGPTTFLDDQKEIVLFRIIQEAFNNILKHSNADKVIVGLYYNDHKLDIEIKDNGVGFDVEEVLNNYDCKLHSGIKNIITRSKLLNAHYKILSSIGKGTSINLSISY